MIEHNAIAATIQTYVDGGRAGKSKTMKPAFHKDATIYSVADGKLEGGPIQTLFDGVDSLGPAPDLVGRIGAIDVNHNTATARLELENWAGARFTDQFALVKVGGDWKIMTKIFYQHK